MSRNEALYQASLEDAEQQEREIDDMERRELYTQLLTIPERDMLALYGPTIDTGQHLRQLAETACQHAITTTLDRWMSETEVAA